MRSRSKRLVFVLAVAIYAVSVVGFGLTYALFNLLRSTSGRLGTGDALYFSLVNQATVGFGDILPAEGLGRVLAGLQIALGILWSAFVPALVIYRLVLPDDSDVVIGKVLVFDPMMRRFIVRLANRGSQTGSGVMIRAWLRRPDPSDPSGREHFTIGIGHGIEASTRFPLLPVDDPFYFRFDRADPSLTSSTDEVLGLHPAHLVPGSDVLLQVEMRSALGVVAAERVFDLDDVACGKMIPVQKERGDPLVWPNIDRLVKRSETEEGVEFCYQCEFRDVCTLVGRAN